MKNDNNQPKKNQADIERLIIYIKQMITEVIKCVIRAEVHRVAQRILKTHLNFENTFEF